MFYWLYTYSIYINICIHHYLHVDLSGLCPMGWVDSGVRCYKLSTTTGNAADAETFCASQHPGATLAKIESVIEQNYLVNNVSL